MAEYRKQQFEQSKQVVQVKRKSIIGEINPVSPMSTVNSGENNITVGELDKRPDSSKSGKGSRSNSRNEARPLAKKKTTKPEKSPTSKDKGFNKSLTRKPTKKGKKGAKGASSESPSRQGTQSLKKSTTKKPKDSLKRVQIDEGLNEVNDIEPAESEQESIKMSETNYNISDEQAATEEEENAIMESAQDTFESCFDSTTEK